MPDKESTEGLDEPVRDEPEVVPAISAEQPGVGAAIGVEAFGNRAGEAADEVMDNDEESHVPPSDNDGETVPG
jgi:hypothetical protein